jgi:hypothetical protein
MYEIARFNEGRPLCLSRSAISESSPASSVTSRPACYIVELSLNAGVFRLGAMNRRLCLLKRDDRHRIDISRRAAE